MTMTEADNREGSVEISSVAVGQKSGVMLSADARR
jgi:hypothetical protein